MSIEHFVQFVQRCAQQHEPERPLSKKCQKQFMEIAMANAAEYLGIGDGNPDKKRDAEGHTMFHWLAVTPTEPRKVDLFNMFSYAGGDPNASAHNGYTPLHCAVLSQNVEMLPLLMRGGADPNASDKKGRTPAHLAAQKGYTNVLHYLLHHGANPDAADEEGQTPLHIAAQNAQKEKTDTLRCLVWCGANPNASDKEGCTPAHLAVMDNNVEILRLLIEAGLNLDIRDRENHTPETLAVQLRAIHCELLLRQARQQAEWNKQAAHAHCALPFAIVPPPVDVVNQNNAYHKWLAELTRSLGENEVNLDDLRKVLGPGDKNRLLYQLTKEMQKCSDNPSSVLDKLLQARNLRRSRRSGPY